MVAVVVAVVVVVTDTEIDSPTTASLGAKNDAAASLVKKRPLHFSLSDSGALKCCLSLCSSIAAIDFDFLLLFQHRGS